MIVVFVVVVILLAGSAVFVGARRGRDNERTGENRAVMEMTLKLLPTPVEPPAAVGGILTASLEDLPDYPGERAYERDRRFLLDGDVYKLFSLWSYASTAPEVLDEYEAELREDGWERHGEVDRVRVYRRGTDWWLTVTPQTPWQADLVLWQEPVGAMPTVASGAVYQTWTRVRMTAAAGVGTLAAYAILFWSQARVPYEQRAWWGLFLLFVWPIPLALLIAAVKSAKQAASGRPALYFPPGSPARKGGGPAAPGGSWKVVVPPFTRVLEALAAAGFLAVVVTAVVIWLAPDRAVVEPFTFRTLRTTWKVVSTHNIPLFPLIVAAGAYLGITCSQWVQIARERGDARVKTQVLYPPVSFLKAGLVLYGATTMWELVRLAHGQPGFGVWPFLLLIGSVVGLAVGLRLTIRRILDPNSPD